MKIVLTVHRFLPDFSAGTEILTFATARELQRRGHNVVVWTSCPGDDRGLVDTYDYEGIPVMRYYYNKYFSLKYLPRNSEIHLSKHIHKRVFDDTFSTLMETEYRNEEFGRHFSRFLIVHRPDVVHFFHLSRLSAIAIQIAWEYSIPMLYTATDFWLICPTFHLRSSDNSLCLGPGKHSIKCVRHLVALTQPRWMGVLVNCLPDWLLALVCSGMRQRWWPGKKYSIFVSWVTRRVGYLRENMNRMDRVLVPTKLMNNILVRNGLESKKALFLPYGVISDGVRKRLPKRQCGPLRLGFIGALNEHKGVHILLEAINLMQKDAPVEVKIYGNEHEFPSYVNRLKKLAGSDPRISFCGTFPNEKIGDIFADIDVLVVPSLWYENVPLVIYSAQVAKTPVIATNVGGIAEVIQHEKNGLLFERGKAIDLCGQIQRLSQDRELFSLLSENAEEPKSITTYVKELENIYEKILAERRERLWKAS